MENDALAQHRRAGLVSWGRDCRFQPRTKLRMSGLTTSAWVVSIQWGKPG